MEHLPPSREFHNEAYTVPSKSLEVDFFETSESIYIREMTECLHEIYYILEHAHDDWKHWTQQYIVDHRGIAPIHAKDAVLKAQENMCRIKVTNLRHKIEILKQEWWKRDIEIHDWIHKERPSHNE